MRTALFVTALAFFLASSAKCEEPTATFVADNPISNERLQPVDPKPQLTTLEQVGVQRTGGAWARAEFLLWSLSDGYVPPLIMSGTPGANLAVPGSPGTSIVYGDDYPGDGYRPGTRITVGTWLTNDPVFGIELQAYWLSSINNGAAAGSLDGLGFISSSPFINALNGLPAAFIISTPGLTAGEVEATYSGRDIWGGDLLGCLMLCSGENSSVVGLAGFRAFHYSEAMQINKRIFPVGPGIAPGSFIMCNDGFETNNSFHGLVLGVSCMKSYSCCTFVARPTIAVGHMESTVKRTGTGIIYAPPAPPLVVGDGFYNLSTNLGTITNKEWSVLPALDLRAALAICDGVSVSLGYSVMYISNLARVGEQIDHVINPNFLPPAVVDAPGPRRPAPFLDRSPAWLQGATIGLEVRF